IAEADLELPELRDRLASVQKSLSARERALGVEGKKRYNHLASSQFITDLMNARALKLRLRQKLQSRKFERDRLERMFRQQLNTSERKLHNHTESSVKRRNPRIQTLAQQFNQLQVRMAAAVKGRKTPSNAVVPRPIPMDKLFDLDVDDAIWDDIGLGDSDDLVEVPLWLSDEQVRTGIQGILVRDRSVEELQHLRYELSVLGEWSKEEWDTLMFAMSMTDGMKLVLFSRNLFT
ncbi:hypothetical protein BDP27DRAFT_1237536, partial [Rhodocollybia butyracea]